MKNHLVIGGSSGIGRSVCEKLVSRGDTVHATFLNHPVESDGIHYHHMDVREATVDLGFLPEKLDGLVFCPGSISLRPFTRLTVSDFQADLDLQVGGFIKVLQAALPRLKASGSASVVTFSSVAATTGLSFHTQVAVTKSALEGLTRALAAELAPAIRVNCIAPSLTDTPLAAALLSSPEKREANAQRHPLKRLGEAADIAEVACFLLSDASRWMTGQVLHVDGGLGVIR